MKKAKRDINQEITDIVIKRLEAGDVGKWQAGWLRNNRKVIKAGKVTNIGLPTNIVSKNQYQGINTLSLSIVGSNNGYNSAKWGTYKQWQSIDCNVNKDETGTPIVFYSKRTIENKAVNSNSIRIGDDVGDDGDDNNEQSESRLIRRIYYVFNACQVSGYDDDTPIDENQDAELDQANRIANIDKFVKSIGAQINIGQFKAFYSPSGNYIEMPPIASFKGTDTNSPTQSFYGVLLHELIHWSACQRRLNFPFQNKSKKTLKYAKEELVAELGSSFLCAQFGIEKTVNENSVRYLKSWLRKLKNDNTEIFKAAAYANKAVQYLNELAIANSE